VHLQEAQKLAQEEALRPPPVELPPPFWTASLHLNLTEPQVRALEGWIGESRAPRVVHAGQASRVCRSRSRQADQRLAEAVAGRPLDASKVLYLASRDGFEARTFHRQCDGRGPTVTLVRTDTGHVFGGYTAVPWSRGELLTLPPRWRARFHADPDSFVFRLASPKGGARPRRSQAAGRGARGAGRGARGAGRGARGAGRGAQTVLRRGWRCVRRLQGQVL
jgi:hypothetical protein